MERHRLRWSVRPALGTESAGEAGDTVPVPRERMAERIAEYQRHESDSGSTEVQVALLTERIANLTEHLQRHTKDNAGRRGIQKLVGQRRRLLKYLENTAIDRYRSLIKDLGLRR